MEFFFLFFFFYCRTQVKNAGLVKSVAQLDSEKILASDRLNAFITHASCSMKQPIELVADREVASRVTHPELKSCEWPRFDRINHWSIKRWFKCNVLDERRRVFLVIKAVSRIPWVLFMGR